MFRSDLSDQRTLFAFTPRDLIPEDSDVWLYADLFDSLDLSAFLTDYSPQGEEAVHPVLILRTIFYGLTHGVATGRKLQDACVYDMRYAVLSGQQAPSYRLFYRFVARHQTRFAGLFADIVRLAQKMGLVSLGRIAIDGTKMKANTSRAKAMSYDRMRKAIDQITSELATLKADLAKENATEKTETKIPSEIRRREDRLAKISAAKAALEREAAGEAVKPKAQKSFADHDAIPIYKPKDGFTYGYNCQAAVDERNQIIVSAGVHDSVSDVSALPKLLDRAKTVCGKSPNEVLADTGYKSGANLETIAALGSKALIATGQGERKGNQDAYLRDLRFHPVGLGHYRCPRGKVLAKRYGRQTGHLNLFLPKAACNGCPLAAKCSLRKNRGKDFTIPPESQRQLRIELEDRMASEAGRASYRRRKAIVEPVFGNIKNKRLRIGVRGTAKVAAWWQIVTTAHNVEKIVGAKRLTRI